MVVRRMLGPVELVGGRVTRGCAAATPAQRAGSPGAGRWQAGCRWRCWCIGCWAGDRQPARHSLYTHSPVSGSNAPHPALAARCSCSRATARRGQHLPPDRPGWPDQRVPSRGLTSSARPQATGRIEVLKRHRSSGAAVPHLSPAGGRGRTPGSRPPTGSKRSLPAAAPSAASIQPMPIQQRAAAIPDLKACWGAAQEDTSCCDGCDYLTRTDSAAEAAV